MLYAIKNLQKARPREQGYKLLIRNLTIKRGDKIALTGPSGCGKSTTLDILGLSLRPDSADEFTFAPGTAAGPGRIEIMPLWQKKSLDRLATLRLKYMGYVLQSGELLPYLSVGENITLPAMLAGMGSQPANENGKNLANKLGIGQLWNVMPATLSVGERQRAAIVRALTPHPQIILADEPTAALDPLHAEKVMDAFLDAMREYGGTLVLVTHNSDWAKAGGLVEIPFKMVKDSQGVTAVLDNSNIAMGPQQ